MHGLEWIRFFEVDVELEALQNLMVVIDFEWQHLTQPWS